MTPEAARKPRFDPAGHGGGRAIPAAKRAGRL